MDQLFIVLITLGLLVLGRYWLAQGLGSLARAADLPTAGLVLAAVVNAVIVEVGIAVAAACNNEPMLGLGLVLGAILANTGLVMGLAAGQRALVVESSVFRREVPAMFLALLLLYVLCRDFTLSRTDGVILLGVAVLFLFFAVGNEGFSGLEESVRKADRFLAGKDWRIATAVVIVALAAMVLCFDLFAGSVTALVAARGLNGWVFSVLPLAALVCMAKAPPVKLMLKKEGGLSAASLLTFNTLNILLTVGILALYRPLYLSPVVFKFDIPVVAIFTAAALAVIRQGARPGAKESVLIIAGYLMGVTIILAHAR